MSKISDTNSKTIKFSISQDDYIEMANDCLENDEFNEAIMHANNAYDLGKEREIFFILPQAYYSLDNQDMALASVSELMASYKVTRSDLEYLSGVIAGSLEDRGRLLAAYFFLNKYGEETEDDLTQTFLEDGYKDFIERAYEMRGPKLEFSDTERLHYNAETLLRAHKMMADSDYKGAMHLIKSLYDTEADRYERIRAEAICNDGLNNTEKVLELTRKALEIKPTIGILPDILHYNNRYPQVVELLKYFRFSDDSATMEDVASLANRYGAFDYAKNVVERLIIAHPNAIKYRIMKALINWNLGDKEQSKKTYFALLYTMRLKYPVDYIARLRFPDFLEIGKNVPEVLDKRIYRMVTKELAQINKKKLSNELKRAIIYLFTDDNFDLGVEMIGYFDNINLEDEFYILKRLISDINTPKRLKKFLIKALILKGHKGKFFYNADGYILQLNIKRPPSYEEYGEGLRKAYADSFAMLADSENTCTKHLIKMYEKLFELGHYVYMDSSKLARAAAYIALEESGTKNLFIEEYCNFNGIDISDIDMELSYIRRFVFDQDE